MPGASVGCKPVTTNAIVVLCIYLSVTASSQSAWDALHRAINANFDWEPVSFWDALKRGKSRWVRGAWEVHVVCMWVPVWRAPCMPASPPFVQDLLDWALGARARIAVTASPDDLHHSYALAPAPAPSTMCIMARALGSSDLGASGSAARAEACRQASRQLNGAS